MEAKSALTYCQKKYVKSLSGLSGKKGKQINESFLVLEQEIKKLDPITQINLYSITTQMIESLINDPHDAINPIDVFNLRCQSILGAKYNTSYYITLGLALIGIACAVLVTGGAIGIGIGILVGLWQTPLICLASLMAFEMPALGVAALSISLGVGVGVASGFLFFKEPKIVTAKNDCIELVKESYLKDYVDEIDRSESTHTLDQ
nr:hypothetical protein [Legionella jordanis]